MPVRIRFLCDENVRSDVAQFLSDRGHEVIFSRDVVSVSAPDQLLAIMGSFEGLVVITHDKDFKNYRRMIPEGERGKFAAGAGRLWIKVPNVDSPRRIQEEIEVIEFHFGQALQRGKQFDMTIQRERISVR